MDDRLHRFLKYTAVTLTVAFLGYGVYGYFVGSRLPGDYAHAAGSKFFADGQYAEALESYEDALTVAPKHYAARVGRAETLILLGREQDAIDAYDELIDEQPDEARLYANRGIAYDRTARHEAALANYQKALSLGADAVEGPGWLTRFLRNQAERPPGVAERARYLREQLALPENERVLALPEQDDAQRPYKN